MDTKQYINMVILDDFQNYFSKIERDKRLPTDMKITVYKNHFENSNDLINKLKDCQIIVGIRERTKFPQEIIDQLPKLRLLITTGARNASFDLEASTNNNIVVSGTPGGGEGPVDLTWGLILSLIRKIHEEDKLVREGQWGKNIGPSLDGKTLGLLGLGHIGKLVSKVGLAFGMSVIAWSENLTDIYAKNLGVKHVDKQTLFKESDILSIHTKLSDRTKNIISEDEINLMKTSSYIINTSRGPIIEEKALVNALNSKKIAGAAIDTFDIEPLPSNHPLLYTPNTLLTPHIGYVTYEAYEAYYEGIIDNVISFLNDNPVRVLNPDVLKKLYDLDH